MSDRAHLLIEIGTEELPPKSLDRLGESLFRELTGELEGAGLDFDRDAAVWYATPRRLAVSLPGLARQQADRNEERLGPAVAAAFDEDGSPRPAAEGFARSCGVSVSELKRVDTDKGVRLAYSRNIPGALTLELLPEMIQAAAGRLPVARPMRWGERDDAFVRPVHWVVALLDSQVISGALYGCNFDRVSQGHRFHHDGGVSIDHASSYLAALEQARVIADPARRREMIRLGVERAVAEAGGNAVIHDALLSEVANLTEWPVPLLGSFDEEFLEVPAEALISSMESHQKFFSVVDDQQQLMALFVGVANLDSTNPTSVRDGFERVIRPRLADARFFWEKDLKTPLEQHRHGLAQAVYQRDLGSLWDKVERVARMAQLLAPALGVDPEQAKRAARLSKCDLMTEMVGEFPELQGTMGRHYALAQDESQVVAAAIEEHYQPRQAGTALPASPLGQVLALADRIDSLCGIFSAGLKPTGNRDPFALRRAGLGLIRILVEKEIDLDLETLITQALDGVAGQIDSASEHGGEILEFIMDRLRAWYLDQGIGADVFEAVWARRPTRPLDFHRRVQALTDFKALEPAAALAAANKRIGNILKKSTDGGAAVPAVNADGLVEAQEKALFADLTLASEDALPMIQSGQYGPALVRLSDLRPSVDAFFDHVMVMCEDEDLKNNRLALLSKIKSIFDDVADISRLVVS
ncbi:MAG: glycine--tRNA ligase subunit beta [Xanthomonadales bacterium]|nr:glycine--tRNA ligase subunit beta [Xanthomonadales bacterium]